MSLRSRMIRSLVVSALVGGSGLAQSPHDLIERDRQAQAIAFQKVQEDVVTAIMASQTAPPEKKAANIEQLKALKLSIAAATYDDMRKKVLTAKIDERIVAMEGRATIVLPGEDANKVKAQAQAAMAAAKLETEEVTKGLKKVHEFLEANKQYEAGKVIAELSVKYPTNPAVTSLKGANLTANNLAAWRKIQDDYAAAWVADQRNTMASAMPVTNDITFPNKEKWKEITDARKNMNKIKLSEREQKILESLNTVVNVYVKDRPFQEALQEFSNQIKQELTIDTKSLEDAGLDLNRKTNFSGNVSARTALRALLQPQGLTYVVKDEIIHVVTLEKAEREMLTTRSYDVSDIVDTGGPFSNAVQFGPQMAYQQTVQNADAIVALIKESIDPRCWKDKGGFCSVQFHLPTKSIVVRASTEVHAALGGSITGKK